MKRKFKYLLLVTSLAFTLASCTLNNNGSSINGEGENTVETIDVRGVTLNKNSLSLYEGNSENLVATITPQNADNQEVIWSSNDESVAIVSEGKVSAIKEGTAIITVTTKDGGYSATCTITVSKVVSEISVTGVSLNYETIDMYVDKKITLIKTISPNDATNTNVIWSSTDESVVKVSDGTIVSLKAGTATITCTTVDGSFSASCIVNVYENDDSEEVLPTDNAYVITTGGEYDFKGTMDKQIYIDAEGEEVVLNLNGVTLNYSENSPIYVVSADKVEISAKKDTTNFINDSRAIYTEDEDGQGKGAIYVGDGDLKLKGKGSLEINASYYNGIHCKDDVEIKNLNLKINSVNHGVKGNDSITIESGNLDINCGGDGFKTENTDISSKGNQRGNITINGGTIKVNSWGDAISAAYDTIIEELDSDNPITLDLKTNKYSSYSGEVVDTSANTFYLKMDKNTYSSGKYTYAAYIDGEWYGAIYKGTQSTSQDGGWGCGPGGGSSTYYFYELNKPSNATSFTLYRFNNGTTTFDTNSANASSDIKAFNTAYDTVQISVSSSKISFSSWSNYNTTSGSNTNKSVNSSKGIKAENEVYIKNGTINISAYDDGIHTNNDASLENGSTPIGNINISGGSINIKASDDGIHADSKLNISGGEINVTEAYEGLEANVITISGGTSTVYATDDGVNATKGNSTPNLTVSGGRLDVSVSGKGDTDGIDSNGSILINGGVTITRGPNSQMAGPLDSDNGCKATGGNLIVIGYCPNISTTLTKTTSSSGSSKGSHTVTIGNETITYNNSSSYNGNTTVFGNGSAIIK